MSAFFFRKKKFTLPGRQSAFPLEFYSGYGLKGTMLYVLLQAKLFFASFFLLRRKSYTQITQTFKYFEGEKTLLYIEMKGKTEMNRRW